jgi:hypothetical protein
MSYCQYDEYHVHMFYDYTVSIQLIRTMFIQFVIFGRARFNMIKLTLFVIFNAT